LALPSLPAKEQVRLINTVPSALAELVRQKAVPGGVRTVNLAGEALPAGLVRDVLAASEPGKRRVLNLYGPSEDTTYSTWAQVDGSEKPLIGGPLAHTQAYVTDSGLGLQPLGGAGELLLGGRGLARGYLGRPGLTAERFVPDPFSGESGSRLYRTGDLARWRRRGQLEFLGRRDHQVKIRGFRIELEEISAVLTALPGVRDSVVTVKEWGEGDRRLVAYLEATGELAVDGLRERVREVLPEHMVPSYFVSLEALPRTPNGKVDRKALPAPEGALGGARPPVAPRDAVERQLADLWQALLGVAPIGVETNFFELGGHSLLGVRLMAALAKLVGRELPVATLFRAPTIAQLAQLLRQEGGADLEASLVPLRPEGEGSPFFWIHPGNGTVFLYRALAQGMPAGRPIYGLQSQGLDGSIAPISTIEGMAAHYVSEIRRLQAEGPYSLGGWSMGGLIAVEMARQLAAAGQEVAPVLLLDARVPNRMDRLAVRDKEQLLQNFAVHFGFPLEISMPMEDFQELDSRRQLAHVVENAARAGELPMGMSAEQLTSYYEVFQVNLRAVPEHRPGAFSGRLILFRARDPIPVLVRRKDESWLDRLRVRAQDLLSYFKTRVWEPLFWRDFGWRRATGARVEVHTVEGHHYEMLAEEHLGSLAASIEAALRRTDREGDKTP
ncbi:MAG: AMP-binding protein, partial [Acidobacteria bacterium]|nr:AMP-binding protein [Acidobacteriota bacterium]